MRYGLLLAAQGSAIGMGILLPDDIRNISIW
jgi:SNF family Na+-dependent transporter